MKPIYVTSITVFSGALIHNGKPFAIAHPEFGWSTSINYGHMVDGDDFGFQGEDNGYAFVCYYDENLEFHSKTMRACA